MARITVEDCLEQIENRFDLVLAASRRAHQLKNGAAELLPWDDDKPTVLALREIAAGKITEDILNQPQIPVDAEDQVSDLDKLHREVAETKPETLPEQKGDDLEEVLDEEAVALEGEPAADAPEDETPAEPAEAAAEPDEGKPAAA